MILSLDEIEPTKMIDVAARNTKSSFTCYIFVSLSFFIHAHDNVCFALFSKYCMKAIFHGFGAADPALRTERPRRAERLSRQLGGGGKGVRRGTWLDSPPVRLLPSSGPRSFFAVARNSPYGRRHLISGPREGQARERVCAILLSSPANRTACASRRRGADPRPWRRGL
jgi:hypothetical protein